MKIHRLYMLRPKELRAIHDSIGGKYSFKERFDRDGNGSPFLYYTGGHPEIDELNERCVDQLRINFEEFKNGLMLGITERTEPYIMPLRPEEILSVKIKLQDEKVSPRPGSFFNWLLSKKVPLAYARFFAGASEYEEPKTFFSLHTLEYPIHAWITADVYKKIKAFFQKSLFKSVLEIEN
ncbi:MAG: hypothetical protein AAFZ15_01700 [Bacteroidota bacterium]